MLKLRLKRCGKKRNPSYRIILINNITKRDGYAIEDLGFYNPISKKIKINVNRVINCIKNGAQLSETVKNLFFKANIIK